MKNLYEVRMKRNNVFVVAEKVRAGFGDRYGEEKLFANTIRLIAEQERAVDDTAFLIL